MIKDIRRLQYIIGIIYKNSILLKLRFLEFYMFKANI